MILRTILILFSAVVAAVILALTFELPQPDPIDPNSMLEVKVVPPREPVPVEGGEVMDVGDLTDGYVHRPGYSVRVQGPPAPIYPTRVREPEPTPRARPAPVQNDPVYYGRYVREQVRQEPPRREPRYYAPPPRYAPPPPPRYEPSRPRQPEYDPDPSRPRIYYDQNGRRDDPPPPPPWQREERRPGCNAMASWCDNSRAREDNRARVPENRGEDYFE